MDTYTGQHTLAQPHLPQRGNTKSSNCDAVEVLPSALLLRLTATVSLESRPLIGPQAALFPGRALVCPWALSRVAAPALCRRTGDLGA